MRKQLVGLAALVAVIGIATGQASAATLTQGGQVSPNTGGALNDASVVLFSSNNAPISVGNGGNVNGWDPWGAADSAVPDTNSSWMSIGGANGLPGAFATWNIVTPPTNTLSFIWGSPNSDNTLTLYSGANGVGSVVATIAFVDGTGFVIDGVPQGLPFPPNNEDPGFVQLLTTTNFLSFTFTNSIGGFEVAALAAGSNQGPGETPLPAALPLFVSGLGALGFFGYRRKKKKAAAAA